MIKTGSRLAVKLPLANLFCTNFQNEFNAKMISDVVPEGNVELVNRLLLDAGITTELIRFWREDDEP